jgi:hypothetical protein
MGRQNKRKPMGTTLSTVGTGPHNGQSSTGAPLQVDMQREAELRELLGKIETVTREAHEVLKDLRIETRQARRILPMIVAKQIKAECEKQMRALADETIAAANAAAETVNRRFDRLSDLLLGKDRMARKEGLRPIPDVIEDIVELGMQLPLGRESEDGEGNSIPPALHGKVPSTPQLQAPSTGTSRPLGSPTRDSR